MKICPVGDELLRAYRRTDMSKLTVAFRNFANGLTGDEHPWPQRNSKPVIQKIKCAHTYALDRTVIGIGQNLFLSVTSRCDPNTQR